MSADSFRDKILMPGFESADACSRKIRIAAQGGIGEAPRHDSNALGLSDLRSHESCSGYPQRGYTSPSTFPNESYASSSLQRLRSAPSQPSLRPSSSSRLLRDTAAMARALDGGHSSPLTQTSTYYDSPPTTLRSVAIDSKCRELSAALPHLSPLAMIAAAAQNPKGWISAEDLLSADSSQEDASSDHSEGRKDICKAPANGDRQTPSIQRGCEHDRYSQYSSATRSSGEATVTVLKEQKRASSSSQVSTAQIRRPAPLRVETDPVLQAMRQSRPVEHSSTTTWSRHRQEALLNIPPPPTRSRPATSPSGHTEQEDKTLTWRAKVQAWQACNDALRQSEACLHCGACSACASEDGGSQMSHSPQSCRSPSLYQPQVEEDGSSTRYGDDHNPVELWQAADAFFSRHSRFLESALDDRRRMSSLTATRAKLTPTEACAGDSSAMPNAIDTCRHDARTKDVNNLQTQMTISNLAGSSVRSESERVELTQSQHSDGNPTLTDVRRRLVTLYSDLGSTSNGRALLKGQSALEAREADLSINAISKHQATSVEITVFTEHREGRWLIKGPADPGTPFTENLPAVSDVWHLPLDSKAMLARKKLRSTIELAKSRTAVRCDRCGTGTTYANCTACNGAGAVEKVVAVIVTLRIANFLPLKTPSIFVRGRRLDGVEYIDAQDEENSVEVLMEQANEHAIEAAQRVAAGHWERYGAKTLVTRAHVRRRPVLTVALRSTRTGDIRHFQVFGGGSEIRELVANSYHERPPRDSSTSFRASIQSSVPWWRGEHGE